MNLLLSNDDGYTAPGLKALVDRLSKEHKVYVVAPAGNRSAVSHHITMFSDTEIHKISDNLYSCEGYPADCVSIGLMSDLFDVKFDAVVSGINCGANLGTDIVYSGTCGAARQATFNGIPAIACSVDPISWENADKKPFYYENLADFVAKNLEVLLKLASVKSPRAFVNINAPAIPEYKGVKCGTELCVRDYHDHLHIEKRGDKTISVFDPGFSTAPKENELCDYTIVQDGYICVSVVYADAVCKQIVDCTSFKL